MLKFNRFALGGACCIIVSFSSGRVMALDSFEVSSVKFQPGLELGVGYINNVNQDFGSATSLIGLPVDRSGDRMEAYAKPSIAFSVPTDSAGEFFGKASSVTSLTRGDSDGLGYTSGNPTDTDWDDGMVGWKKTGFLNIQESNTLSLSVGRQPYKIGTGFVIGEGHIDQGHEGAYWLAPRKAFDWSQIAKIEVGKGHLDVFELKSRTDIDVVDYKESLTMRGADLGWSDEKYGQYGFTTYESHDNANSRRDGLKVNSFRAAITPLTDVSLSGEYVWQRGKGEDDGADAWYLEGTYTFSKTPWQPSLTYRYSKFGHNYDSMLYGYNGDWGYWFQGEIVGENMLFNMNQKTQMLKFTVHPTETIRAGVIGYDTDFEKAPEGVDDKAFAKEVNLYVDWFATSNWSLGALVGYAIPGDGAKQAFGDGEDSKLLEAYVIYSF